MATYDYEHLAKKCINGHTVDLFSIYSGGHVDEDLCAQCYEEDKTLYVEMCDDCEDGHKMIVSPSSLLECRYCHGYASLSDYCMYCVPAKDLGLCCMCKYLSERNDVLQGVLPLRKIESCNHHLCPECSSAFTATWRSRCIACQMYPLTFNVKPATCK